MSLHSVEYSLPREMWLWAFDFLSVQDLCQIQTVCRTWREIADDDVSWKSRVYQEFGSVILADIPSWRELYKLLRSWVWMESGDGCHTLGGAILESPITAFNPESGKVAAISNQCIPLNDALDRFFQITVTEIGDLFAVGVADINFPDMYIYSWKNNGTGWYSSGGAWSDSTSKWSNNPYARGDKITMHLNMQKKTLQYYRNKDKVGDPLDMKFVEQPLHVIVLLGKNARCQLRYSSSLDSLLAVCK